MHDRRLREHRSIANTQRKNLCFAKREVARPITYNLRYILRHPVDRISQPLLNHRIPNRLYLHKVIQTRAHQFTRQRKKSRQFFLQRDIQRDKLLAKLRRLLVRFVPAFLDSLVFDVIQQSLVPFLHHPLGSIMEFDKRHHRVNDALSHRRKLNREKRPSSVLHRFTICNRKEGMRKILT